MELKRKSSSTSPFDMCATTRAKCSKIDDGEFKSYSLIKALISDNIKRITEELHSLKKYLTTKEHVLTFLNDNKCFNALTQYFIGIFNEKLKRDRGDLHSRISSTNDEDVYSLIREIVSILANMSHLSVSACLKIRDMNSSLINIYLHFLNKKEHFPVKLAVLRLIGNLCELKETATMIALNASLVDKVVNCLKLDEQKINEQSLRIIRLMAKRSQLSKIVLRSNCCLLIAKYIAKHKNKIEIFCDRPEILQTVCNLFKFHPNCVAKQFAECSDFVQMCLDLVLKFPSATNDKFESHWLELILRCVRVSHELRSALGEKAIYRVLEHEKNKNRLADIHCRFLCAFLEDNYFRLHMRYGHPGNDALNKILERLEPHSLTSKRIPNIRLQNLIVESLCSLHYDDSLEFVIRHPAFIPSVLNHVRCYLDQEAHNCRIEYIDPEQKPLLPAIIDQSITQNVDNQFWPLCKNFSQSVATSITDKYINSPSMSPSSSSNISSSPGASPPSFECSSTIASSPSSFQLDDYLQMNENCNRDTLSPTIADRAAPSEIEPDDPMLIDLEITGMRKEDEDGCNNFSYGDERCLMQRLVHNELRLIAHFSHKEERQSIFLINEEIITLLVRYISEAEEMDNRLARALRRLSCHQSGLPLLLEMDFQRIIISKLIRRECLLKRFARPCVRCDVRRDFGRLLLSDHALLADSRMGEYILLTTRFDSAPNQLSSNAYNNNKIYPLMAALVLIRHHERRSRFFLKFRPINVIFDVFSSILRKCSQNGILLAKDCDEGKICCDIVTTLASIFPHQLFVSSLTSKPISQIVPIIESDKKCILLNPCDENSADFLKFCNSKGEHLLTVLKQDLCTYNEYFSGMFRSEFVEKLESRDQFIFNPNEEACSQENFVKFLHFSIGCPFGIACTFVNDAQTCASLLYLADKYLCTRLLDLLLSGGLAAKLVTGQTLPIFLPLVLAIPTLTDSDGLKDVCMLVLLQYSNNSELLYTLQHIAKCDSGSSKTNAIDALVEMMHSFISRLCQDITPL